VLLDILVRKNLLGNLVFFNFFCLLGSCLGSGLGSSRLLVRIVLELLGVVRLRCLRLLDRVLLFLLNKYINNYEKK
jgi:hypothetical protein